MSVGEHGSPDRSTAQVRRRFQWQDGALLALMLGYAALMLWLQLTQHATYHTGALDLGYYDQTIWNTSEGRLFANTLKPPSYLGDHFSPILLLPALLYKVWADVRLLLALQTVAIVLGVLPLYALVRKRSAGLALVLAAIYFSNPALHNVNLHEFHESALLIPLIGLMLWGALERRTWAVVIGAAATLLTKETAAVAVAMVGLYMLLARRNPRLGAGLLAAGLAWAVVVPTLVIPRFGSGEYEHMSRYTYLGESVGDAIRTLSHDPLIIVRTLVSGDRVKALGRLLLPFAGLAPLLAPGIAALAIPGLLLLLASDFQMQYMMYGWYPAEVLPFLFFGVAVGLMRLKSARLRWVAAGLVLACTLVGWRLYSYAPPGRAYLPSDHAATSHVQVLNRVLSEVPADAPVSAQFTLLPHLSHRERVVLYPALDDADWIVLDTQAIAYPLSWKEFAEAYPLLLSDPSMTIVEEADGVLLLRRDVSPQFARVEAELGANVKLAGMDVAVRGADLSYCALSSATDLSGRTGVRIGVYLERIAGKESAFLLRVRLLDASGQILAESEGPLVRGQRPTSEWKVGEVVREPRWLEIEAGAQSPPQSVELTVFTEFGSTAWSARVAVEALVP